MSKTIQITPKIQIYFIFLYFTNNFTIEINVVMLAKKNKHGEHKKIDRKTYIFK